MTLSVISDPDQPEGGYAILQGLALKDVSTLAIQNCFSGMFLGEDGRWGKKRFMCPIDNIDEKPNAASLGPHIVDFVPTDLQVAFYNEAGDELGRVFWTDIHPSRNPGRITPGEKRPPRPPKSPPITPPPSPVKELPTANRRPLTTIFTVLLCVATVLVAIVVATRPRSILEPPQPVFQEGERQPGQRKIDEPSPPQKATEKPVLEQQKTERPLPSNNCPSNPSVAYEQGLQKYLSDDLNTLYDSERLLKCALAQGYEKAKFKLGRLYIKMATATNGSFDQERSFYKKACDEGDMEGCDKLNLKLDH